MVLGSQSPRSGMGRQYMVSRRRRSKFKPMLGLLLMVVLVGGIYWLFFADAGQETPDTTQTPSSTASAPAPAPAAPSVIPPPAAPAAPPAPAPATPAPSATAPAPPPVAPPTATPAPVIPPAVQPTPPRAPLAAASTSQTTPPAAQQLAQGMREISEARYLQGRRSLSVLLFSPTPVLSAPDAEVVRDTLTSVNRKLVFSRDVEPGDTICAYYKVQKGDYLSTIAPRFKVPYPFVERINNVAARNLRIGQNLKMVKGPIHARVSKKEFRMDMYVNADDGQPIFLCSFPVGLGEDDSTPAGTWLVEPGRKVKNPDWRNPRTGEYYTRDNPENPIGEYWLALKGTDDATRDRKGYGIHGTTDPSSIGRMKSMGCIRLRDADVAQVYDMLLDGASTVEIVK